MIDLSGDPYAGARQAYLVLNPNATDEDWEAWIDANTNEAHGEFDNFRAFAHLCRDASNSSAKISESNDQHIAYSAGWFEAMGNVFSSLLNPLPISEWIPHHLTRHISSE